MIHVSGYLRHRQTLARILSDVGLVALVMVLALFAYLPSFDGALPLVGTQVVTLAGGMFLINTASGLYLPSGRTTTPQVLARAALALLLALPLTYAVCGLLPDDLVGNQAVRFSAMAGVAAVVLRRVYASHVGAVGQPRTRVLVVGTGPAARLVTETLRSSDPLAEVVGYYPSPNESDCSVDGRLVVQGGRPLHEAATALAVDEIVVALTERRAGSMPLRGLLDCKLAGIRVHDVNSYFERWLGQVRLGFANAGWMVFGDGFKQGATRTVVKRLFDIVCSLLLLVVSAPVMLLAAALVKLDSPGPVLYRQQRVGLNGKPFMVAKFRSMRTDAEKDGQPRWAAVNDDRITRIGALIRRLRIDELPQLFNVLRGEMSLVGPRPERPYFVDQLTRDLEYFAARHSVKPGVTGWAQVRYQYGATIEDASEKLQYDLYYVKNHTLILDLLILFETVAVVLTGKGAR